jgi:hypothetical protein
VVDSQAMLVVEHLSEGSLLLVLVVVGLALASVRAAESLLAHARWKADAALAARLRSSRRPAEGVVAADERAAAHAGSHDSPAASPPRDPATHEDSELPRP